MSESSVSEVKRVKKRNVTFDTGRAQMICRMYEPKIIEYKEIYIFTNYPISIIIINRELIK